MNMTSEHAHFDELAAGYALSALDPADERAFAGHLPSCGRCQHAVADYQEVAAALASAAPAGEADQPPALLRDRIMAATSTPVSTGASDSASGGRPPALVRQLPSRRLPARRLRRVELAAAGIAAVALAVTGTVIGVLRSGDHAQAPVASCAGITRCSQVVLTSADSGSPVAKVLVTGQTAWLVGVGLPPDNPSRQIYVLWQISSSGSAVPLGGFDVRGGARRAARIGSLAFALGRTKAFAVSLEHGRVIPATPSRAVASGLPPPS